MGSATKHRGAGSGAYGLDRIEADLGQFTRHAWTSDRSREAWEWRIARVSKAWEEMQWRAVEKGLRSVSVTSVRPEKLPDLATRLIRSGLNVLPLGMEGSDGPGYSNAAVKARPGRPYTFRIAVGSNERIRTFQEAWEANDSVAIGELLGYPDCCRRFFHEAWVEHGLRDTTWAMAYGTVAGDGSDRLEVSGPPETNILWRFFGVRAVAHLPCRFDCSDSIEIGRRFFALGRELGFGEEVDWATEILSWPVEWSAYHGIAEIKTPIVKVSSSTDATSRRHVVCFKGSRFPEEGARGLGFPYQAPVGIKYTGTAAFERGLANPIGSGTEPAPTNGGASNAPEPALFVTRVPGTSERIVEGDLVVYFDKAEGWVMNDSAASIWRLCDGTRAPEEIGGQLASGLGLPHDSLDEDVRVALATLEHNGLVIIGPRNAPAGSPVSPNRPANEVGIDWARVAAPQPDGYDTEVLLARMPRDRRGVHGDEPRICAGRVAVRRCYGKVKGLVDAPLDHPNIALAVGYLRLWPRGFEQFSRLMHAFHPFLDPERSAGEDAFLVGSHSHSAEDKPGTMWSTVNCALMLACNWVHELAHQKLFALGIGKESCTRWILNDPAQLYRSPVITDRQRPMTAVVHGVYAFSYVLALEMRAFQAEPEGPRRQAIAERLRRNSKRLVDGMEEIRTHVKLDSQGAVFFEALYGWWGELIRKAGRLLGERVSVLVPAVPRRSSGPVRVFVGTEPRMEKAEIALEASIREHTAGPVEIVWMDYGRGGLWAGWNVGRRRGRISAELAEGWATEFSGFRYAIPEAAGFSGRAIYLDVDMIALRDLRELFETPLTKPVLMTPHCSAAMLFDCSHFADKAWWPRVEWMKLSGWGISEYHRLLKENGAIGPLDGRWNCHDGEGFQSGVTGVLHFTRRRTQPWRPYPEVFDYKDHPDKQMEALWWRAYERGLKTREHRDLQPT